MINGHGNNLQDYGDKIKMDFSSNIAFNHSAEQIGNHLKKSMHLISNYPDPVAKELTQLLADHHHVSTSHILVTNGSAEAFYLIAHLFQGVNTAIYTPAFAEYEDACKLYNHKLSFHPLKEFDSETIAAYNTVWLGNPNNPDGTFLSRSKIDDYCQKSAHTHLIVDEAYTHLCSPLSTSLRGHIHANLITVHSLTKAFAIPGLRLGYIIAHPSLITRLAEMRPPWTVNALALEAGCYIMKNYDRLHPSLTVLQEESVFLQKSLDAIDGIKVYPSLCNFFLCELADITASECKQILIDKYGILIRDASNFRGLTINHIRIAAQSHHVNLKLIDALHEIMQLKRTQTGR